MNDFVGQYLMTDSIGCFKAFDVAFKNFFNKMQLMHITRVFLCLWMSLFIGLRVPIKYKYES